MPNLDKFSHFFRQSHFNTTKLEMLKDYNAVNRVLEKTTGIYHVEDVWHFLQVSLNY